MTFKIYSSEMVPEKITALRMLSRLEPGQAFNVPAERIQTFRNRISILNKIHGHLYRSARISDNEFAIIREQ
jgi:hypothetical protein